MHHSTGRPPQLREPTIPPPALNEIPLVDLSLPHGADSSAPGESKSARHLHPPTPHALPSLRPVASEVAMPPRVTPRIDDDSHAGSDHRSGASTWEKDAESMSRMTWLAVVVVGMISIRYFVPWFAEQVQYSITRGRERALYDLAGTTLQHTPVSQISTAGQLVTKRISPSLVHINVTTAKASTDQPHPPVFFGPRPRDSSGQGSGVIVDAEGFIVTNYHVVENASEIDVGLSDGRRIGAQLVGYDKQTDLAVLRIEASDLVPAEWGDSEAIDVGSAVWAAGSPFGLQRSVTFGILSAKHRGGIAGTPYQDFLQTDAAVNPGNSGGPLVDEFGRIIGINTAIVGEAYQGVSFAIPSHVARDVYERLRRDGRVARGWLGVQMDEVTENLADQMGLPKPYGALVVTVVDIEGASPAQQAGIEAGDVILAWNGEEITNPSTLSRLVARTQIGAIATIRVQRGREQLELQVTVGERPPLE